ncbi:FMN-binding glutamate synthase family protein [Parasphingorhabdus sp.]|uniref:FMN-binding glutamate synthase family protein n=1 Tax=Parasphingorhabdus sp. TaxID=2709688 RepID=UPI003A5C85C2
MPSWFFRSLVPLILLLSSLFFLLAGIRFTNALWGLAITIPLLATALLDFVQTRHSLRRNYPLIARFRWLFEDLRPYLRSYIVESDLDGRPFNKDERALVYARSKNEISTHPFGTELDVYSDEYEWLSHSIVPNDAVPEELRIMIGGPQCTKPYSAAILNISAMSFGSVGGHAIEALNMGAKKGGFYHDTGEGSYSKYHAKHGGDIVWELGSGYFGCRDADGHFDDEKFRATATLDQIKMIEIKLSQGAKPGHGGVLPGTKVTKEIAETRGVPAGENCISPVAHSAFSTPLEMLAWAARLREMSGGKPVGIKLCVGQPHEVFAIIKAMLESNILLDFIVVDGAEGGTGAAPVELSNRVGMPLREGLILVRNALVGAGLKDRIRLGAAGKVVSGAGLAINMAVGADWCNAARAFMFSLGCVQSMKCHTGDCPTGVATQDPFRQRGLVIGDKAERVYQFQKQTVSALRDIVVAMGLENPWQIRPHHLHERLNSAKSSSIDYIYPFLENRVLIEAPDDTPYAQYWAAAQTSSFRARPSVKQTLHDQDTDP